jgi:adenylate kinase
MIILVAGLDDSGRDEIVEMVLQSYKKMMPVNTLVKAADFIPDVSAERGLDRLSKMRDNSLIKLERTLVSALKNGSNIVLAAGLTRKTVHGYMPVVTRDLVDTIKPDLIVLMEILPRRADDYMEHEHIDWTHQRFERQTAGMFSVRTGAPLRIIKVRPGKVKDALKEAADALRAAMD